MRSDDLSYDMPEYWGVITNEREVGMLKAEYTHDINKPEFFGFIISRGVNIL